MKFIVDAQLPKQILSSILNFCEGNHIE